MELTIVLKVWMIVPAVLTGLTLLGAGFLISEGDFDTDSASVLLCVWLLTAGVSILTGVLA